MQRTTLKELLDKYRNDLQGLLNSIFGSAAANLSPEVLALQALVEKYAKQYGISDHVGTLLAIIQVESGGVLADVMQSSESAGLPPGAIKDKEASINQGCKYYAELVKRAKQLGVDGDSIVQAYNYGGGFLDYVAKNGKKYSFELAESFAKQHSGGVRVLPLPKNAISTAKNGGWRYNYGNMFYVMLVQQYTGGAAYGSENLPKLCGRSKEIHQYALCVRRFYFADLVRLLRLYLLGLHAVRRMQSPANDSVWYLLALHTNLGLAGTAG